jgi:hypothetical protein
MREAHGRTCASVSIDLLCTRPPLSYWRKDTGLQAQREAAAPDAGRALGLHFGAAAPELRTALNQQRF